VRAFVESCRYPHHLEAVDPFMPTPLERMRGEGSAHRNGATPARQSRSVSARAAAARNRARRRSGASRNRNTASYAILAAQQRGELLLGVKLESPEGIARCEEILSVPGIGFAELGPGDLSLALGYREMPRDPYPPEMQEARDKVFAACRQHVSPFSRPARPRRSRKSSTRGYASSPVIARRPPASAAPTRSAHSQRKSSSEFLRKTAA